MVHIDTNFSLHYDENIIDIQTLNMFIKLYSSELKYILEKFQTCNYIIKLTLLDKPSLDTWVNKNSISYKGTSVPSWLVGFSSSEDVLIVCPNKENISNMVKVAIHESIHNILYNKYPNSNYSKLLDEGLATYFSKQKYNYYIKDIKADIALNQEKSLSKLNTSNTIEFQNMKGYSYCYFVIDFLLKNYDMPQILSWYRNIDLFRKDIIRLDLDFKFNKYLKDLNI